MRCLFALLLSVCCLTASPSELWYPQPAGTEAEAFPLGDGNGQPWRVYGDPKKERIEQGDTRITLEWLDGDQEPRNYRRALDLDTGVATATWKRGGSTITCTELASLADDVFLIHLLADMPGALGFRTGFAEPGTKPTGNRGELAASKSRLWVFPFESEVAPEGNDMVVRGEGEALIVVSTGAGSLAKLAAKYDPGAEHPDASKLWHKALEAHVSAHRTRMGGCVIDLGGHEAAAKPTDERLKASNWQTNDPGLAVLMDQYGRYLTRLCLPATVKSDVRSKLVEEKNGTVILLPALPEEWKDGSVKNLPVGAAEMIPEYTVDMAWKDGRVTQYEIHRSQPTGPEKVKVRINGSETETTVR
ncbi:glycoside hydrolase N-terminal domain-containing protein [Luteolibacter ambystomatis]|uniref:Glycoside hydrolase N-terminal domain-containing protein n=1 Tax=Luteolibacter ambystomatis TaxID=2824561 RepID=A0A975IYX5_9BACT|nr:glycoside hydrolase N-terminal domain-containing protein [Luteolibacter ambystomatis]QUE50687.1 glycoside hydrolase N-terminal domain-containing protein [Luteolibacter ambystomatis]